MYKSLLPLNKKCIFENVFLVVGKDEKWYHKSGKHKISPTKNHLCDFLISKDSPNLKNHT